MGAARFAIAGLLPAAAWLAGAACTDAQLYAPHYQPNIADLTGVVGDLCTDDPASLAFPLKIVVVVDGGVPNMLDDRLATLQAMVKQYGGTNVSFD